MNKEYAKSLAERFGNHWFDADTMRFFNSRMLDSTWTLIEREMDTWHNRPDREVWRFVSSEQDKHPYNSDFDQPRFYTVRQMTVDYINGTVSVDTVGEFQAYGTSREAKRHVSD